MKYVLSSILLGYALGSIPFSFLIPKLVKGIDIRKVGSRNVGGSNVIRSVGLFYGIVAALLDILKALLAVLIVRQLGWGMTFQAIAGTSAVLGHNWSVFLRLGGGRGIGCTLAVLLLLLPKELAVFASIILLGALAREVAFSVFLALLALPIVTLLFREPTPLKLTALALTLIALFRRVSLLPQDKREGLPLMRSFFNRLLYDTPVKKRLEPPIIESRSD